MGRVTVLTSPDGITWTIRPNVWDGQGIVGQKVRWNGAKAVATGGTSVNGTDTLVLNSTNGATWVGQTLGTGYEGNPNLHGAGIAWSSALGLWVTAWFFPNGPPVTIPGILSSPDGATWTGHSSDLNGINGFNNTGGTDVLWDGSQFVAVGSQVSTGFVNLSTDGLTWTHTLVTFNGGPGTGIANQPLNTVEWDGAALYVTPVQSSGSNRIWHANNGQTWVNRDNAYMLVNSNRLRYGGAQWVGVGIGFDPMSGIFWAINTSPDGTTWTPQASPWDHETAMDLAWNGSQWVLVGASGASGKVVMTSPDAVTWTERSTPIDGTGQLNGVCWAADLGLWIAVGDGAVGSGQWILG